MRIIHSNAVMLILCLGLKAKFCGLGLRDLALAEKIKATTKVSWDYKIHHRDRLHTTV